MDVLQNHVMCWRRQPQLSALYFFIAELFYGNEDMMQWSFIKIKMVFMVHLTTVASSGSVGDGPCAEA